MSDSRQNLLSSINWTWFYSFSTQIHTSFTIDQSRFIRYIEWSMKLCYVMCKVWNMNQKCQIILCNISFEYCSPFIPHIFKKKRSVKKDALKYSIIKSTTFHRLHTILKYLNTNRISDVAFNWCGFPIHTSFHTFAFDYISLRINAADFRICFQWMWIVHCVYMSVRMNFSLRFDRKTIRYIHSKAEQLLRIDCWLEDIFWELACDKEFD